jgi:hypothetical protein
MTMFDQGAISYKSDLKLGEKYRDTKTKLEGHLVAIVFYEHACERGSLRFVNGQGEVCESTFDAPELVHIKTGVPARTEKAGGPDRGSMARRTPPR